MSDNASEKEKIDFAEMPELEKWVLHRVSELSNKILENTKNFNLHDIYTDIHNFCTIDLSAFYFDIRKDTLYCDPINSNKLLISEYIYKLYSHMI